MAKIFKGMYEPKLEFPEGWEVETKKPSVGGVCIFSGTTHFHLHVVTRYIVFS